MNRIADIPLPDLAIMGEFAMPVVDAVVKTALAGNKIVWEQPAANTAYDLGGTDSTAWISRSALSSLREIASVPNATYEWEYEGTIRNVRFRHEDGAIEATPVRDLADPEGADWYANVTIRLMEV